MPTKNPDTTIATIEEEESSFYDYNAGVNNPTTCYYYDGQMSICESYSGYQGENFVMDQTRNTIGGRGIDMIEAQRVEGPSGDSVKAMGKRQSYPIYDGHGNMLATLVKNGSSYTLQNEKRYDPWGGFTVGPGPGAGLANPNEAYCGNLGHKSDAESDFIYMRARYYEPGSGRFISQDPGRDGSNLYSYCNADPVNQADPSGKTAVTNWVAVVMAFFLMLGYDSWKPDNAAEKCIHIMVAAFVEGLAMARMALAGLRLDKGGAMVAVGVLTLSLLSVVMFTIMLYQVELLYAMADDDRAPSGGAYQSASEAVNDQDSPFHNLFKISSKD